MSELSAFKDLTEQLRDRKIKQNAELERKDKEGRFHIALFNCLKTSEGRAVFKYLFDLIPVEQSSFSSDPLIMAFNEGKRAVSVELRNVIKTELGIDALIAIDKQEL